MDIPAAFHSTEEVFEASLRVRDFELSQKAAYGSAFLELPLAPPAQLRTNKFP